MLKEQRGCWRRRTWGDTACRRGPHDQKEACGTLAFSLSWKETSGGLRAVKRKTWVSKEGACTKAEAGVGERGGDSECGLTGALALSDGFGRGLVRERGGEGDALST